MDKISSFLTSQRLADAYCAFYGYRATLPDGSPNPETRQRFALRHAMKPVVEFVENVEREAARQAAAGQYDAAKPAVDL